MERNQHVSCSMGQNYWEDTFIYNKRYCVHKEGGNKSKTNGSSIGHHSFDNILLQNITIISQKKTETSHKSSFS